MTSYLLSPPAEEPISLVDAKAFVRQDHAIDDPLLTTLISAARIHIEGVTGHAIIAQEWRVLYDDWPENGIIDLPVAPFRALTQVTAYDDEGNASAINLVQFQPEAGTRNARLILPKAPTDSPVLRAHNGIEVDYLAGHAASAAEVPNDLKQAVLTLVAHWYQHRDAVIVAGSGGVVPTGFDALIGKYRKVHL